jgi:hypothetical protein
LFDRQDIGPERVGNNSNLSGLTDLMAKPSLESIK